VDLRDCLFEALCHATESCNVGRGQLVSWLRVAGWGAGSCGVDSMETVSCRACWTVHARGSEQMAVGTAPAVVVRRLAGA
jgi:hypothetical protein